MKFRYIHDVDLHSLYRNAFKFCDVNLRQPQVVGGVSAWPVSRHHLATQNCFVSLLIFVIHFKKMFLFVVSLCLSESFSSSFFFEISQQTHKIYGKKMPQLLKFGIEPHAILHAPATHGS